MTIAPHRAGGWWRLPAVLTSTVGLAATLLVGAAPVPALDTVASSVAGVQTQSSGAAAPVSIVVSSLSPSAPQRGELLTVSGTVRSTVKDILRGARVRARVAADPLSTRDALESAAAGTDVLTDARSVAPPTQLGDLGPGQRRTFRLLLDTDDLQLGEQWGVYRFSVEVLDSTGDRIANVDTFLPWMPPQGYQPTRVAWVWPLTAQPTAGPTGAFLDDTLGAALAPSGRLGRLVTAASNAARQRRASHRPKRPTYPRGTTPPPGPQPEQWVPVPVTYAVDPAVVDAARTMSDTGHAYQVGSGDKTHNGSHATAAAGFLSTLDATLRTDRYFALPYGDPDIVGLTRAGGVDVITAARSTGVESHLRSAQLPGVVWPPTGFITPDALDALTVSTVVLDGDALPFPPGSEPNYTPTAVTTVPKSGGPITALVSDPTLSSVAAQPVTMSTRALAVQRFLAETAMITREQPSHGRTVVITPPQRWNVAVSAGPSMLQLSGRVPWLAPVTLDTQQLGGAEDATQPARSALTYPRSARAAELPQPYLSRVADLYRQARAFRSVLCPAAARGAHEPACSPDPVATPIERSLFEAASTAFRSAPAAGDRLLAATADRLSALQSKVRITTQGDVTYLSSSGQVPITIANDLPERVAVELCLEAPNTARLRTGGCTLYTIEAHQKRQLNVQASTTTAGVARFPVHAQLRTPRGEVFGGQVELTVHVTKYGAIAVAITVGALVLLLAAVGVRLTRRVLTARRGAAQAG